MTSWVYRNLASSIRAREPSMVQCAFMRRRMLRRVRDLGPPGTRTVRDARENWHPLAPGVDFKLLRRDERAHNMTAFIRMQPGSALDAHVHAQSEECFLVRGEIFIGAQRLREADMHVAAAGTTHSAITSPQGALLLVRAQMCR
jgi:mannose-6-phosphate isomerase-like protein (cupin superfamily)